VDPEAGTVTNLSQQFLTSKPVSCDDPELLASVVLDLENHRDQLMLDGAFLDSMKAQKAVDAARSQQLDAVKKRNQAETLDDIRAKQAAVQDEYEQFQKEMKEQEQDFEIRVQEQVQQAEAKQQQEIEEHDQEWQAEPKQRLFNRSSQQLRILRTQQQLLMNARRFDEAAQVCRIADSLAARETQGSHRAMLVAFLQSRYMLEQRHVENRDTLMKAVETRRGELRHIREIRTRRFRNRIANLQIEEEVAKDPERLWVRKHRNDGDQVVNCTGAVSRSSKLPPKQPNVCGFNVLALPPLVIPGSPRKNVRA
jgi:hypothetical protein